MNSEIYLIRHAESAPSKTLPEPDWPLSDRGREQAQGLSLWLEKLNIEMLFSSPFPRAIHTLQPFAESKNLEIQVVEDFRERKLTDGMVEGFLEILQKTWTDFDFKLPNCESSNECQVRVTKAFRDVAESNRGKTIAICSHGNAIGLFLNSIESNFGFLEWKKMKNPDIFRVEVNGERVVWNRDFVFDLGVAP